MDITGLIDESRIVVDPSITSKDELLHRAAKIFAEQGLADSEEGLYQDFLKREAQTSTGIEEGFGIPHAKSSHVSGAGLAFFHTGVIQDYKGLDGSDIDCAFTIVVPADAADEHLQILSTLAQNLAEPEFRDALRAAKDPAGVLKVIGSIGKPAEAKAEAAATDAAAEPVATKGSIVAVTSCPTGIAHTYMAAQKIEDAAKKLGYAVKVETQGAKVENVLTQAEIDSADLIVLATDRAIDLSRFSEKSVVQTSTGAVIKDAEGVIEQAFAGNGLTKIGAIQGEAGAEDTGAKKSVGQQLYTHFMAGVNMMLPFVIAGGIIIALSFAFGIHASDPNDPTYNPLAEALNNIGGNAAFALMVPALAAGIAQSIAGKQGFAVGLTLGMLARLGGSGFLGGMVGGLLGGYIALYFSDKLGSKVKSGIAPIYQLIVVPLCSILISGLVFHFFINAPIAFVLNALTDWLNSLGSVTGVAFGLLIGCMMAFDMGGPVNKAISTFAIGLMSQGIYAPVCACMAAGMTPPLGLALATHLFPNKFTKEEKIQGNSCWILGLSYITEGAIPFAVADPLRVIPSLMVGSAAAAAISLGFGVESMAPHGGIWVILIPNVISNPLIYALAIAVGMVLTALVVGILKKPVPEDQR